MNFVLVGGGTGISTLLKGLKYFKDIDLKAIVTVTDEGGSSGVLRKEYNIIPPGDIRNNLVALAKDEEVIGKLFSYRFSEGFLAGHTVGNIMLTALTKIFGSFTKAVEYLSEVLAINGKVIPVTEDLVRLIAVYDDGTIAYGESEIMNIKMKRIIRIFLDKKSKINVDASEAIKKADFIIFGPGSLFTSIIPNLLVDGFNESLEGSKAKLIYVSNLMTQPSESYNFTLKEHVDEVEKYIGRSVDYIIASNSKIPEDILKKYQEKGSIPVKIDLIDERVIVEDLAEVKTIDGFNRIRHNSLKLASVIIGLIR
ncbi:hypothetical protein SU69_06955 [Thermosipho melanesiensis]|uniref:Putative gluconeogenesis factor n=2 Tax=Thermosipho melanesiensis TaxID=46541 RepID=A6LMS0_THEM4|nr:gluconeogenesis factor YvcK family protein [Thermosipho melanesiensis]ABR31221.1 protein of unknown function UPF0052 and CofD [Thermosipho melanesiensis BI429]APT74305.1 hypothetical protein BW47_07280 [Thermosipho melanesiensis]OOC36246.1 hypothetical protein SU68_07025 [Thermosipho melanesiensis]OOC37064.1 hypothetical protein SU69_06955 [Thermosipho melanesiensis]OOC37816.1 hypothetical protein SU70_06965 [Thermosipho melanesiensis]